MEEVCEDNVDNPVPFTNFQTVTKLRDMTMTMEMGDMDRDDGTNGDDCKPNFVEFTWPRVNLFCFGFQLINYLEFIVNMYILASVLY